MIHLEAGEELVSPGAAGGGKMAERTGKGETHVAQRRKVGKEGVVLQKVAHVAGSGGTADPLRAVIENIAVNADMPGVRVDEAGDGLQGQRLA